MQDAGTEMKLEEFEIKLRKTFSTMVGRCSLFQTINMQSVLGGQCVCVCVCVCVCLECVSGKNREEEMECKDVN